VIVVVATDAPLFPSQCKAMARRVTLGLARTGITGSHTSGDIFLAVSTANPAAFTSGEPSAGVTANANAGATSSGGEAYNSLTFVPWNQIDPFYEAVVQATEEAVANALIANEDMTGRDGHRSPAPPRDRLAEIWLQNLKRDTRGQTPRSASNVTK
jgi:D-aminopeptidase